MKIIKYIIVGILVTVLISLSVIFFRFWPTDPRLNGTFKSDKEATITYLESTRNLRDEQRHFFNQIFGHLTLVFNGHKMESVMEPHTIKGYAGEDDRNSEGWSDKSYFFVAMSNKDNIIIVDLPSPIWNLNDAEEVQIEFDQDGFWVYSSFINSLFSGEPPFKEKFKKIR